MTEITINPDKTLSVTWKGKKGRGSLVQLCASGDVDKVNALGMPELFAVAYAVRQAPYPLGNGEAIYRLVLNAVLEKVFDAPADCSLKNVDLGDFRKAILARCSQGVNAPYDSYLSIAYDIKTGKTPVHYY